MSLTNEGVKTVGKVVYCKECTRWSTVEKGEELILLPCGHTGKAMVMDVLGNMTEIFAVNATQALETYLKWPTE